MKNWTYKIYIFFLFIVFVSSLRAQSDLLTEYDLKWTTEIKWNNLVDISQIDGETLHDQLDKAQQILKAKGGGVVYFPAGVYHFKDHIIIKDSIVLRGADPINVPDARKVGYNPPTCFEFPKYNPTYNGNGTPINSAFKGIILENPNASNCGLMNIKINRGHLNFMSEGGNQTGHNRFVVGCVFTNAAVADPGIPSQKYKQHSWQRFTARHHAAITVKAFENILIANNRIPESGSDNFTMKYYIVKGATIDEVVFDYDNRPGLYINDCGIGGPGGNGPDGTPETHPWGFRKGIIICNNYIFCTGRCAISFTGDGTICKDNTIRFKDDIYRPTTTGTNLTKGSSTNDNRAIQMRGWRWTVEGNDYLVYRNICSDKSYRINDGEGLMHEDHVNSTVLDSKVSNNKGNSYISIYKTGGINGLVVRGNDIRTSGGIAAIYVVADKNSGPYKCTNVIIENNTTSGSGIQITGSPAANNIIRNNKHLGQSSKIINQANAQLQNNSGYDAKND